MIDPLPQRSRLAAAPVLAGVIVLALCFAAAGSSARYGTRCDAQARTTFIRARSLACAEALRLLNELTLPGSAQLSGRPSFASGLKGPFIEPLAKTLVERHAFWSIPLAPAQTVDWIRAHLPAGWRESVRGENVGANGERHWEESFSVATATFEEAAVLLTAESDRSGGSVVRVDAQVVWFPPRPRSSLVPAGARSVTLVLAPARSRRSSALRPGRTLRPGGALQPGRAIRPPLAVTDPIEVGLLVQAVNALHLPSGGPVSCTAEPVSPVYVWLIFRERSTRPPIAIAQASPTVCGGGGFVSLAVNGRLAPVLDESDKLIAAIHAILGVPIPNLSAGGLENMRRRRHKTFSPPGPFAGARAARGELVGHIRFVGGPALPPRSHFPRARPSFSVGWVHVYGRSGRTVALVHVEQGHRFRISLPAGAYRVLASQTRRSQSSLGCPSATVVIAAHRSSHVTLLLGCAVR